MAWVPVISGLYQKATSSGGGSGNVVGPASATDGVVALFDGTTGKLLKAGSLPGDMLKSVYDPQLAGKISGLTSGSGIGGILSMVGANANAGSINTDGNTFAAGSITTTGGDSAVGGNINTAGGTSGPGGSIITANGGGSFDSTGTGTIQLGVSGTRTTLTGSASTDRAISIPDIAGPLASLQNVNITQALTTSGITPAADGTYSLPTSITIQNGIITVIS